MSRKTFGKVMPKPVTQNLELMGEQIMLARKRRHFTMNRRVPSSKPPLV